MNLGEHNGNVRNDRIRFWDDSLGRPKTIGSIGSSVLEIVNWRRPSSERSMRIDGKMIRNDDVDL